MQAEIAADYLSLRALDADRALLLSSIEVYRKSLELVLHRRAGGMIEWPSRLWAVGSSLTLPLFQGGQLTASFHQAKAAHEETVAKYRQTVLTAFAEVENNLAAQHLLANEYEQELAALQSARKLLEVSNNRYRAGLVTYLEVATAQIAALGTERASVRLRGQQLVAVVALIKSLGGGWRLPDTGGRES